MEKGSYKGRRVDFEKYELFCFNPFLFCGSISSQMGCGACALALLTGTPPATIAARNGGVHYSDKFMVQFLRQNQFDVVKLTLCNLTMAKSELSNENCLLVSQLYTKNEATWGVMFSGTFYHGFRSYKLDSISLINKPVLSAYVVVHPRWRIVAPAVETSTLKPRIKNRKFTLATLAGAMRFAAPNPQPGSPHR